MVTLNVENGQHSHGPRLVHEVEKRALVALSLMANQLHLQQTQLWMSDSSYINNIVQ